jgi:cyclopropane fatty-acyl-phospholipid synthase-like methyltransferase
MEQDGCFTNTPEAQSFLVKGSSSYMGDTYLFHSNRWSRNLKTAESLRTGIPQAHWDFSGSSPENIEASLRRINVRTIKLAKELLERYDFSSTKSLVDVGGGGGALAITMVKACPTLRATIIDLRQVTPITQKIVAVEGLADRITIIASDVAHNPVHGSYEAAVLVALLHVLSKEDAQRVVQNLSGAVLPGGSVYLIDMILDDSRISPPEAIGFNLTAINAFEDGSAYTESEGRSWLRAAGFVDIQRSAHSMRDGHGLMTARKGR